MKNLILICIVFTFFMTGCARRTVVVSAPSPTAAVVKTLPKKYKVVRIRGVRYYYFNGRHYKKTSRGYVVVRV